MILQITLTLAAAAAVISTWLMLRIIRVRIANGISHGDGGVPLLARRMRAQANFIETTPIVLILVAAIELTGKGGTWLAVVGAVFMLGRLAHGFGMDIEPTHWTRQAGMMTTVTTILGLAAVAVLISLGMF